jgi:hypothetical protein
LSLNVKARNDWSSTLSQRTILFSKAVSGSFVLTEAFPAIKLGNKINLIKFRASAGEVGKGADACTTNTYFAQSCRWFWSTNCFPFNGNAGFLFLIQRVIRPYTRVYKEVALELKWHF